MVKNPPANARDIKGVSERSPRGEYGNPFQYSCLENLMDRGAWWATVHEVAESDMTEQLSMHVCRDLLQVISWRVLQACLGALPGLPRVPVFGCSVF